MYLIQYKRRWVIWRQMLTHPIPSKSVSISCRLFASHVTGHVTTGSWHLVLVALKKHNTPSEWKIALLNADGNEIMNVPSFLFFRRTEWKNIILITSHEYVTPTDGELPPSINLARFDLNKDCCLKLYLQTKSVIISANRFEVFLHSGDGCSAPVARGVRM